MCKEKINLGNYETAVVEELSEEDRELLFDEEEDFIPSPRHRKPSRAERFERQKLEELDPMDSRSVPVVRKKGIKGFVFLAVLEILAILTIIGWWLQWLI